jgi:hypothetical protein
VNVLGPNGTETEQISFLSPGLLAARDFEGSFFLADHWVPNERISLDLGLRYAGQTLGRSANLAPRLGAAYSPGKAGKTIFRGGVGRFYAHTPLLGGNFTMFPTRQVSYFDDLGNLEGTPITYENAYGEVSRQGVWAVSPNFPGNVPYNWTWNVEGDQELHPRVILRLNFMSSRAYDQFIVNPVTDLPTGPAMLLTPHGASRYQELESTVHFRINAFTEWTVSYVYSKARGDLNTLAQVFVPFEQPIIHPDVFSNLASDIPNRLLSWGRFKTHVWGIEAGPVVDYHTGFPFTPINMRQDYIGTPNTDRFPQFVSLDTKLGKDFHLPLPVLKKHLMHGSLTVFNLTNHSNPRDVFNNNTSPDFGHFVGNQHRFLDTSLDVLY